MRPVIAREFALGGYDGIYTSKVNETIKGSPMPVDDAIQGSSKTVPDNWRPGGRSALLFFLPNASQ